MPMWIVLIGEYFTRLGFLFVAFPQIKFAFVAPGVRGFPAWGKFHINLMKPKEDKERPGWGGKVLLLTACLSLSAFCPLKLGSTRQLPVRACGWGALLTCPTCPFWKELHGWAPGDWWAPDQLSTRKWRGGENACGSSPTMAHCYGNRLSPGRKCWVKTYIYPIALLFKCAW